MAWWDERPGNWLNIGVETAAKWCGWTDIFPFILSIISEVAFHRQSSLLDSVRIIYCCPLLVLRQRNLPWGSAFGIDDLTVALNLACSGPSPMYWVGFYHSTQIRWKSIVYIASIGRRHFEKLVLHNHYKACWKCFSSRLILSCICKHF